MKCILVGYPGSRGVREASKALFKKYMPNTFEPIWLEYDGPIEGWSGFVEDYLDQLEDDWVIFTLDDYLLSGRLDYYRFKKALKEKVVATKLCYATDEENESYPVTTQYTLWDRRYLIRLLGQVNTPWEFELKGSEIFKQTGQVAKFVNVIPYYTNSSLSSKWKGVRLDGLSEEDIKLVQKYL